MHKITDYYVIKSPKVEDLMEQVNARIKDGWAVLGPAQAQIQPAPGGGGHMSFLQTMVR